MAHTPGPWIVRKKFYIAKEGDPFSFAEVKSCNTVPAEDTEQHEANARLIAAAPDLLAALEDLYANIADTDCGFVSLQSAFMVNARAAIHAARGDEPKKD